MDIKKFGDIKIFLAPMEGITHPGFRKIIGDLGAVDYEFTDFLRITNSLHSKKIFKRHCPEVFNDNLFTSNRPISLQLLGSDSDMIVENALRAVELGITGIDINFGCPAKIVNRHHGGAYLLQYPELIDKILATLYKNLPKEIHLSAKIRLGYNDTLLLKEIISAINQTPLDWLTVHCRTKKNGYAPPAYWEFIPLIREWTSIPLVANGDIFTVKDFIQCFQITRCQHYMIGRGVYHNPFLFLEIKNHLKLLSNHPSSELFSYKCFSPDTIFYQKSLSVLRSYFNVSEEEVNGYFATAKVKGWLRFLSVKNSEFKLLFHRLKAEKYPLFKDILFEKSDTIIEGQLPVDHTSQ